MSRLYFDPIVVDIETAPHPCAAEFLEPPNFDDIQAPKNYVKPEAIADYIAREKVAREKEHAEKVGKAALDWNLSRIVALAWSTDGETIVVKPCANEDEERDAMVEFWKDADGREVLGFAARTFDVPTLIQRSRYLDIPHRNVNLARYGKGSVIDLRDLLTFDDARYEALMSRSLKSFCKRFGLPCDDTVNGAEVPQLVADGKWDEVISHVTSDVRLTIALARRIGAMALTPASKEVAEVL